MRTRQSSLVGVPVLLCGALLAGCTSLRWEAPPRCGPAPDPALAMEAMSRHAPARMLVVNSVLFEYRGRKMSGLGFLDVNAATRSFALACMAPSGVTLFEVIGSNGTVHCRSALEAIADRTAFAENMARDVARMFLDLQPPPAAAVSFEPSAAVFTAPLAGDRVEWVAGSDGALLEKRYYEKKRLVCRIGYYAPTERAGRRLPGRVVLQNLKHGYGLTLTLREIRKCE